MTSIAYLLSCAAQQTPSPDNSQPWQLNWQGNMLTVRYDSRRVGANTFAADSHATLITMGALLENLSQAAAAMSIRLSWTFPEFLDLHDPVYFQVVINQTDNVGSPAFDSIPLFLRHTNRHPYQSRPIPDGLITELKNLNQDSTRIMVFEDKAEIYAIAQLVQMASEIRFQTREVHEWLAKSLRFDTKSSDQFGDGLDIATIDLPPGGRIFLRLISDWQRMSWLNKLGAYKALAMIDSQAISKAPLVIAVVGPANFRDTITAGQLMNKTWIALNAKGIAAHPYYVVADQLQRKLTNCVPHDLVNQADSVFNQTQQICQLKDGENLHMLFRVGYPSKTPVKSKRLPLNSICSGTE